MKRSILLSLLMFSGVFALNAQTPAAPAAPAAAQPAAAAPAAPVTPEQPSGGAPSSAAPAAPAASGKKSWEDDLDDKIPDDSGEGGTPPPKPDDKKGAAPAAPAKPGEQKKEDGDEVPQFKGTKELRDWANNRHKTAKELEAKVQTYEKQIAELNSRTPKTDGQAAAIAEQVQTLQKRIDDYEQRIRFSDYQNSQEYMEQYKKPYEQVLARAHRTVSELEVSIPTGKTDAEGKTEMTTRAATKNDFDYIYSLPLGKAHAEARKYFGDQASIVMAQYDRVREKAEAALNAIEDYKVKGAEMEKTKAQRAATERVTIEKLWREVNEQLSSNEKFKSWWGKTGDDKEADAALAKGFEFADQIFGEAADHLPKEELVKLHASARHRIAGFYKLRHIVGKKDAEIAALQKQIEDMKGSAPGKPGGGGPAPKVGADEGWEKGIDALPE